MAELKLAEQPFYMKPGFQIKLYGVLSVILVLLMGYYIFVNLSALLKMRAQTADYETLHSALQVTEKNVDTELKTMQEENQDLSNTIREDLDIVFPIKESHTSLTRELEQFANGIHRTKNPFMISNLQYLKSQEVKDKSYAILPFKMTIHSSYDNFFKFLEYVETSGTLSDKTRLIDIQSIMINFISPGGAQGNTSGTNEINFNVSMNAYFRQAADETKD